MAGISEELGLDIGPALQGIDSLEQALQDALRSAEVSVEIGAVSAEALEQAIAEASQAPEIVLGEVDADEVAEAIVQATRDAVAGVEVEDVDASEVTDAIEDALSDADLEIERFDASVVREELEDAASDAELAVEIGEVDASLVGEEIEEEAEDARPRVELDEVDASKVETEIERAARDASLAVEVSEIDASGVTAGIEEAVGGADLSVEITDVDASAVSEAIEQDAASVSPQVVISEVDASAVPGEIEGAIAEADTGVMVTDVDASAVSDAIEDAAAQADTSGISAVGGAAESAGEGLGGMATRALAGKEAVDLLGGAGLAARGNLSGLAGTAGTAGIAIASAAALTGVFFNEAVQAEAVTNRFNRTLGEYAGAVERIDIGGLNTDISTLAIQIGASDEGLRRAATNLALLGKSADASGPQIAETSEQVLALAARAAVMNPELGDAGDIADRLAPAFARGGRALVRFGIGLNASEIEARALQIAMSEGRDEVTLFDKIAAGAALSTERLGDSLGADIQRGSEEAQIQLRSLRTAIGETVEGLGAPLVEPVTEFLQEAAPALEGLVGLIGQGVRLAVTIATAAGPAIQLVSGALGAIASVLGVVASFFEENEAAARGVAIVLATLLVPAALRAASALGQLVLGHIINGLLSIAGVARAAGGAEGLGALATGARQAQAGLTALGTSGAARAVAGLGVVGTLAGAAGFQFVKTGQRIRDFVKDLESTGTAAEQLERVRAKIEEIERDAPSLGEKIKGIFILGEEGFDPFGLSASSRALRALRDEEGKLEAQTGSVTGKLEEARETLGQVPSSADQAKESFAAMATVFQQEGSKAGEVVSQMFQETQSAAESFAEAVRANIPSVTETIQSLEEGAGPKDLVKGLREETADLNRFFTDIRTLIDRGAADTARAFLELGPEAAGALAHSLVGLGTKGAAEVEKATDERNAAIERGNQASEDLLNKLGAGVDFSEMSRKLQEEAKAITEFPAIVANLIRQGFSQVAQALLEQGPIQGRAFAAATQTASQEDLAALNVALGAHEAAIRGFAPAAAAAAASVGQAEGGALVGALGAHSTAAAEAGLGVGNAWQTGVQGGIRIGQAKSTADAEGSIRVIDGVARVVAPGFGAETGAAYGGAIGGGIRGQGGQMADAARATLGAAAAGSGAGGLGALAGKSFSEGMASGIRNTFGPVGAAAIELAKRAVEALIDKIKGRSPSEVTAEIGEDWGAGFILGMERTEDGVARASERLAFAAEDSFRTAAEVASPSRLARSLGEDWAAGIAAGLRAGQEEVALAAEGLNEAAAEAIRPPEIAAVVTLAPVVAAQAIQATQDGAALGSIQVSAPVSIEIPITGPITTEAVPVLTGQVEAAVRRGLADHQRELVSALRAARR